MAERGASRQPDRRSGRQEGRGQPEDRGTVPAAVPAAAPGAVDPARPRPAHTKVVSLEELPRLLTGRGAVVLTNGCFDLLHAGHLKTLETARSLGDVLVVGINSDASVRRLKGPGRPLVPQQQRALLVAALECVDFVTIFDEDTAVRLVYTVRPAWYVKGGDYRLDQLPEAPAARQVG
ncbi:MAG TPA: adenylyltransferase/cytidyltransferase family protein, partial [Thermaerobacter sp.]